jgi:hypothetical protein
VYPDCPAQAAGQSGMMLDCLVVFAIIGAPRGDLGASSNYLAWKASRSV